MLHISKQKRDTTVHISGDIVPVVESVRDLGVLISNDLQPSVHVNDIVSRAHKRAAAILRAFVTRDSSLLMRAFLTYVRPILEYNSIIWSPCAVGDIVAIKSVQRRFTKRLPYMNNKWYDQRLKLLNVPSLEMRRLRTDLCYCCKILFGLTGVESGVFFTPSPCTVTRGHKYKLYKSHNNLSIRANFFTERVISVWNDLPTSVNFSSFLAFKRCIEQVNFDCVGLIFR